MNPSADPIWSLPAAVADSGVVSADSLIPSASSDFIVGYFEKIESIANRTESPFARDKAVSPIIDDFLDKLGKNTRNPRNGGTLLTTIAAPLPKTARHLIRAHKCDGALADIDGNNVLHHAAMSNQWKNNYDVVNLIEASMEKCGVDVNAPNRQGDTAVHLAIYSALQAQDAGIDEMIERLEALGKEADFTRIGSRGTPREIVAEAQSREEDPARREDYRNLLTWIDKRVSNLKRLTKEEVRDMLARGVKDFSKTDIHNLDLRGLRFGKGFTFNDANMANVLLDGCEITHSSFINTNLSGAHLNRAWLNNNDFTSANLQAAHACDSTFFDCTITGAQMQGINLSHAKLDGVKQEPRNPANLSHAKAEKSTWGGSKLDGVTAQHIVLNEATFGRYNSPWAKPEDIVNFASWKNADLQHSKAIKAKFSVTSLNGAHVEHCDWTESELPTQMMGIKAKGANLSRCSAGHVDFTGADLTDTQFCYVTYAVGLNLNNATLNKTNFTGSIPLIDAIRDGCWPLNAAPRIKYNLADFRNSILSYY